MPTTPTEVPKRPDRYSDDISKEVAVELLPKVQQWLKQNGDDSSDDAGILKDLAKALNWGNKDGYELAKDLDGQSWSPDSALVEILDEAQSIRRRIYGKKCEEWVMLNHIPAPKLGMKAKCVKHPKVANVVGTITRIYPDGTAVFTLDGQKNGGYIIAWEDLEF